jgi:glyceraldehyde 3-phosphate dehydrogenase
MIRVAINGFGRIGRNILRAYYDRPELSQAIDIVAINDLGEPAINAHLLEFDTAHGRFGHEVTSGGDYLAVDGHRIAVLNERSPSALPWAELNIDLVLECTGLFTTRVSAAGHLDAGAQRVLVSAPTKDADATIVYGVNHGTLTNEHRVISNASCTTNCLAPVVKTLHEEIGLVSGLMTTIHAYTNDQNLNDVYHKDLFRARAAGQSMIPTATGAANAIGLVLPELQGRLDGLAVRVPTLNVSLVDLSFTAARNTSVEEVNSLMSKAATEDSFGVLGYNERPLVSVDFNHDSHSANFDANHTRGAGSLVKVLAWYDNEWGFSNRMLDNALELSAIAGLSADKAA